MLKISLTDLEEASEMGEKTSKKEIGLAIKTIRLRVGLKQIVLAKKINPKARSAGTISRIERGDSNYTIDMLFRIAEVLGCDVSDFCTTNTRKEFPGEQFLDKFLEVYREQILEEERSKEK